jgi:nitroreductase
MRISSYPIEPLIINRWSPRAMSGEPLTYQELMSLFEAARWAPSSYNNQPWRFIYARRDTPHWQKMFDLLVPFNQEWVVRAAVLILVLSHTRFSFNNMPSRTHSFDTGAALENLALQGSAMGLVVHGMEGFEYDRARAIFAIPDEYTVEALFAVGRPASIEVLSPDLQAREQPSDRKAIAEFVTEGTFL